MCKQALAGKRNEIFRKSVTFVTFVVESEILKKNLLNRVFCIDQWLDVPLALRTYLILRTMLKMGFETTTTRTIEQ